MALFDLVRNNDDLGVFSIDTFLKHLCNRNLVVSKDRSYRCQRSIPIFNLHAYKIFRLNFADTLDRAFPVACAADSAAAVP